MGENNGGRRVAEAMAIRHEFEGLDWAPGRGQPEDARTQGKQ